MTDKGPISPDYLALEKITGKVTRYDPITGHPLRYVYQRTTPQLANVRSAQHPRLQLRREPGGRKGNTPQQQGQRAAFAEAVQAWQAMTEAERNQWKQDAKRMQARMTGYHFFLSRFMREHPTNNPVN